MDSLLRFVTYVIVGAALLYCNIWFFRTIYTATQADDYVISPIKLLGQEDKDGARGIGLAQMLQARLKSIERDLAEAQEQLRTTKPQGTNVIRFVPLFNEQTARLATSLLEPANINVAVGGVQVGGVIPWIQNIWARQRNLSFTFDITDPNHVIVAGDATPLVGKDHGTVWFTTNGTLETAISELSYELLRKHLMNDRGTKMERMLNHTEFQTFATTLVRFAELDRAGDGGALAQGDEFRDAFQGIWPIASQHAAAWPEFGMFAATLAEKARDNDRATQLYIAVKAAAETPAMSPTITALITDGTLDRRIAFLSSSPTGEPETHGPFDVPVTQAGSTVNAVVYYATALGGKKGPSIAQAVMSKLDTDLTKLAQFFGETKPPKPFTVIIGDFFGGAYHKQCSDTTIYVSVKLEPKVDTDLTNFLILGQAVDVFAAAQGKAWDCGVSSGVGLKRVLATELYPAQIKEFAAAAAWLDTPDRPDWVNKNNPSDIDLVANGCAALFLNYLHSQLKIPWDRIVQAGGKHLGQTYANLGLGVDGFTKFRQLLDAKFPRGRASRITNENPFPL